MPFNNDLNLMITYLERFCTEERMNELDNISDDQVNLLLDFLTLAHKLKCDIYATGGPNSPLFLGVGVYALEQYRAPQGNLFLKIDSNNIHVSFELESCTEENLLTPMRVIDALHYLSDKHGHSLLPEDYIRESY